MFWLWAGFIGFVVLLLVLDLGVFHRKAHVDSMKEALAWSALWIAVGLSFSVFVYFGYENQWLGLGVEPDPIDGVVNNGWTAVQKYLTGYIVEESLSMDNVFVIAMMFGFFAVPPMYRHRVLFWGILGAIVMRGVMIGVGARLVAEFHWILYIFGVFLILTALKMLFLETGHKDPNRNPLVRLARRLFPITARYHGEHFIVRAGTHASRESRQPGVAAEPDEVVDRAQPGTLLLTPLALALAVIESTDVIFAVDSIPAIFAITADPFLVFTSNVCAILGLRSLYFVLAGMMDKFRYLKVSLALVLLLVGVKMLVASWLKTLVGEHFNLYLLAMVLLVLVSGVVASLIADRLGASCRQD
ncbi:MAG: TerC/Alx family metal homeostasis membrane protein [Planctomycetes bacterium]|nr:TerC/Alx family metal homeostasis membrane protein [Planctomycetota bacterium]